MQMTKLSYRIGGLLGPNPVISASACTHLFLTTATVPCSHADEIAMADTNTTPVFTVTSAFSIAGVFGALAFAYVGLFKLFPKTASRTDRITFVWLVSDFRSN